MDYDDRSYDAFLCLVTRPERNKDDLVTSRFIAVARSQEEAVAFVRRRCSKPCVTEVIRRGTDLLKEARRLGVGDGDAREYPGAR